MWLHLDLIGEVLKHCKEVFPSVDYAFTTIPTYPSGQIGFLMCSTATESCCASPRARGAKAPGAAQVLHLRRPRRRLRPPLLRRGGRLRCAPPGAAARVLERCAAASEPKAAMPSQRSARSWVRLRRCARPPKAREGVDDRR